MNENQETFYCHSDERMLTRVTALIHLGEGAEVGKNIILSERTIRTNTRPNPRDSQFFGAIGFKTGRTGLSDHKEPFVL